MKRILVTGAGGSAAYNFIESLRHNPAQEQLYIVGTDVSRYHLELSHVDKRYVVPKVTEPRYLSTLNTLIKQERIHFLHSQPDAEVNFLAKHVQEIQTKTLLPNYETIELSQNKMEFNRILRERGVPVPEAYFIETEHDLEMALQTILKHNEKAWLRAIRGAGSRGAIPVKNINHAKMWIDYWRVMKGLSYGDFMVSEFLPGKEYAFQSIWHNGKLLMSQARERIEYIFGHLTVSGQSSSPSVAVTVHSDEVNNVVTSGIRALDSHATGIFCADLKTTREGRVVVTEVNAGRFFTTSFFFSFAGCNMPYYYVKLGLGEPVKHGMKPYNNIPAGWYWVRMMDMGYKLIRDDEWTSKKV